MSVIDIEVVADPVSCRRTAAALAGLARACRGVGDGLVRRTHLNPSDFSGLAADAFADRGRSLAVTAESLERRSAALAAGLAAYADGVDEVIALMRRARRAAEPLLSTSATEIRSPDSPAAPDAWAAWRRAVALWRRARDREDAAEDALRAVIVETEDGTPPLGPAAPETPSDATHHHHGPHDLPDHADPPSDQPHSHPPAVPVTSSAAHGHGTPDHPHGHHHHRDEYMELAWWLQPPVLPPTDWPGPLTHCGIAVPDSAPPDTPIAAPDPGLGPTVDSTVDPTGPAPIIPEDESAPEPSPERRISSPGP